MKQEVVISDTVAGSMISWGVLGSGSMARIVGHLICLLYVTGSAKRYTNAQAMIFLYKHCCSKTRNIFYSNFFGGLGIYNSLPTLTPKLRN